MKLDEDVPVLLGSGDIMDGEAEALGDGADGFKKMFVAGSAGLGVNDDIGGNDLRDALFDAIRESVNLLEICGARDADRGIHKVPIARAA